MASNDAGLGSSQTDGRVITRKRGLQSHLIPPCRGYGRALQANGWLLRIVLVGAVPAGEWSERLTISVPTGGPADLRWRGVRRSLPVCGVTAADERQGPMDRVASMSRCSVDP